MKTTAENLLEAAATPAGFVPERRYAGLKQDHDRLLDGLIDLFSAVTVHLDPKAGPDRIIEAQFDAMQLLKLTVPRGNYGESLGVAIARWKAMREGAA